ncbi:MAG: hypothetical protein I3273_04220 [Candidatus Moeniiplasma glomeromycotorum]|nr:hypothetical protein [Candidatus Moeniiplasma glomeromycotorum]
MGEMPIVKEPLQAKCFCCKKNFLIKYVPARKNYSQKNSWDYWTKNEENAGKKICDNCLRNLYKKRKWEFHKFVTDKKMRQLLSNYIATGKI